MKTFFKWFLVIVWAVVVSVGGYFLVNAVTEEKVYNGTNVKFSTDVQHFLLIDSDSVKFEGASSKFFVLHKVSGETITPSPTTPPLGWEADTYYSVGPTQIPGGKWYLDAGRPTIQITSDNAINVHVVINEDEQAVRSFIFGFISFILWVIGLLILGAAGFYDW